ncbi:GNAT family N-acetyltransferase [Thioalkalivibrio sp. XN279]|uniref:GNAT family N-acetyltransferase n=1 Tax=Thioalkalivibrio sp. XN279 TaxID=2714953 RepID=UPI0014088BB2|nr:GNAT family N-acetyltransferase [Thioalkalivibrio sp. XN279]NHA15368.1 hypothetical protein [Thioalkalivibrio sp. XN279]
MLSHILKFPYRVWNRVIWAYRGRFQSDHHVFVRNGPYPVETRPEIKFFRFAHFADVPAFVREAIVENQGHGALETDARELKDHSLMWVAMFDDTVAGVLHSRRGKHFLNWFVPLRDEDIVFFRVRTYPQFRGRGICPSMYRYIMHQELPDDARAFADCAIYNKSSRRSLEKAGFQTIAIAKPITREWALKGKTDSRVR